MMTAEPNKPESENPETVSPAPASEKPTPELEHEGTESFPAQAEKSQKMERFQRILLLALIGLAVVVVLFLAGFLTDHFARYSPMKAELTENLTQTQSELSQSKQSMADLQSQVNDLSSQLAVTNEDKENLQADLDSANLHIELLRTLVEIKTAHIELQNDNLSGAKVTLSDTATRLETLKPLVQTVDSNLAANMQTRLNLVLNSMDTDSPTAQADLELLAKNLQSVETLLFSKK
jgi:cell division protein FtsB